MLLHQPFYLLTPSPWPITISMSLLSTALSVITWMHQINPYPIMYSLMLTTLIIYLWSKDMSRESSILGFFTIPMLTNLQTSMILFIMSEILFFTSFFWMLFHTSLSPNISLGLHWPPSGIKSFSPTEIPLLNTLVLLGSGASITWSHHSLLNKNYSQFLFSLSLTIILGTYFTFLQLLEYNLAPFALSESIFSSMFFLSTGFHGFHVILGSSLLVLSLTRFLLLLMTPEHHFSFEASAWYWHFVDVIWLFLYLSIYWWST
uniref:Cytochrome c oxidase subunit 3 n=1 Tax=Armillifer agkistrodontis TaxID=592791 RepID=A0A1J0CYI6_ARMAG|nr:cytochrome c oxidase subunit III [Armillifer agkistrodontis]APB92070.1 cytochrome c oxidase subunit III [Armillifer agkistrodontis]